MIYYRMQERDSGWPDGVPVGGSGKAVAGPLTETPGEWRPILDDEGNPILDDQGEPILYFVIDPGYDPNRPTWSSQDPRAFYQIRDKLLEATDFDLKNEQANQALNDYADRFYTRSGRFPTWTDVRTDPEAIVEMQRSALRTDILPTAFLVSTPQGVVAFENTASKGPLPVPVGRPQDLLKTLQTSASGAPGGAYAAAAQAFDDLPTYSIEELEGLIDYAALGQKSTGSGSGSRARLRFDPDQLAEAIRDRWRTIMREEPGQVPALVNEYIAAANQTFAAGDSAADFDTWILNRMRREPRYGLLYANRDPSQSELDYLNGYLQPVGEYGLRARDANAQVIRGLSSGAAPASFAQSLQTSPEVAALGQGPFSRRFAQMIAKLGPLQRA